MAPNGTVYVLAVNGDGKLTVWNSTTGQRISEITPPTTPLSATYGTPAVHGNDVVWVSTLSVSSFSVNSFNMETYSSWTTSLTSTEIALTSVLVVDSGIFLVRFLVH